MHRLPCWCCMLPCQAAFMVCYVITNVSPPYKIGCNNIFSAMLISARFARILCADVHIWLTKFCIAGSQQPTELKLRRLACFAAQPKFARHAAVRKCKLPWICQSEHGSSIQLLRFSVQLSKVWPSYMLAFYFSQNPSCIADLVAAPACAAALTFLLVDLGIRTRATLHTPTATCNSFMLHSCAKRSNMCCRATQPWSRVKKGRYRICWAERKDPELLPLCYTGHVLLLVYQWRCIFHW